MAAKPGTGARAAPLRLFVALAAGLGAGLLPAAALAQVPGFWSGASAYGSACTGCHLTPPQISTSGDDGRVTSALLGVTTAVVQSDSAFKAFFRSNAVPNGSPMSTFDSTAPQADWDSLRQYLMDVVDTRVSSTAASVSPIPSSTSATPTASVDFGTVLASNSSGAVTFSVQSGRSTAVTLNTPTVSGGNAANFQVSAASCSALGTNYANTCTFTVQFVAGTTAGAKSTTLLIGFAVPNVNDPTPSTRRVTLLGSTNIAPVANAGPNQNVADGSTVTLDGSASSDANGDPLSYSWTLTAAPAGSAAALSGSTTVRPTFVADRAGSYTASLVVNDGRVSSPASTVTITASNTPPVANAGPAQSVTAPVTVTLDGRASSDANGDPLTYAWTLTARPAGSSAVLANANAAQPSFTADKAGSYTATLVVNDGTASSAPSTVTVTAADTAPVANAGPAQGVTAPVTVNLDGSASSDANGDAISYAWTLSSRPAGSTAALANATAQRPSFQADKRGSYVASLVVSDGTLSSAASTVTITAADTAPVANAGPAQNVLTTTTVTLDGSGSSDANGDPLTYAWTLTARPAGSSAALSSGSVARPAFVADLAGTYTATLVVNDGLLNSAVASVNVVAAVGNVAPVANAGPAQSVIKGATVQLDGSGSSDANGDALSYAWTLTARPAGSAAVLSSSSAVRPSFVADQAGSYVATLVVNDGQVNSAPAGVTISVDTPPVANAGPAQSVVVNTPVTLDGSASSDAENDPLTYAWTISARPSGSTAALSAATTVRPSFTPDAVGPYTLTLVVNDGKADSAPATVAITATPPAAVFTLSATALNLTAVVGGAATGSLVISNTGGQTFTLGTLTFGGGAAADYALAAGNACTPALALAPGANCLLQLRFAPTLSGARTANLSIAHSAAGSPAVVTLGGTATPAPQGAIALSTLALGFAPTQLGASTTLPLTVQNSGNAALTFTAFTLGGAAAADYSAAGSCNLAAPLAAGAQCTLSVGFQPTALGARGASLTIASDASNGAATVAITGTAVAAPAPQITLTPATLDFGAQTVGGIYPSRSITLANTGNASLSAIAISVQGSAFADVSANPCPAVLAAGTSCVVDIRFTPGAAATAYSGTLQVAGNAAGAPQQAVLAGQGTVLAAPSLVWLPPSAGLDFGSVAAGSVSPVQTLTLLNQGPGGAQFTVLNAVGPDAASFPLGSSGCAVGQVLYAGQTCSIDVRFAPGSAGAKSAQMQVASNGSLPPALTLGGTGLGGPSPDITLSATTLAFDLTRVGASSLPAELTLSGSGSGAVTVSALAVSGAYAVQMKSCPALPFTLAAGSQCTMTVSFLPQAEGMTTGTLSLTTDASPSVRKVALSGQGQKAADLSSGGGCSILPGRGLTDPTLWALVLAALAALGWRRRQRRRDAL